MSRDLTVEIIKKFNLLKDKTNVMWKYYLMFNIYL